MAQETLATFREPLADLSHTYPRLLEMNGALDSWSARWIRTGSQFSLSRLVTPADVSSPLAAPAERDSNGIVITCAVARL